MEKEFLNENSIEFIDLALGGVSNGSWVFVLSKNNYTGAVHQFPIRRSELKERLANIETRYRNNYYISANGFMGGKKRTESMLYSLNNIVIDIDCHTKLRIPGLLDLRLDHLVHTVTHDGVDEYGLLMPNAVVYTGRGLQFWWFHESLSAQSNRFTWNSVGNHLLEIMQQILADNKSRDPFESFAGLSVDMCASFAPAGVYRIPGTRNVAAKCKAEATILSERRYTLDELKEFNGEHKKVNHDNHFSGYKYGDCSAWAKRMLFAIQALRIIRDNKIGAETRNNFCLVYYCMLVSAGYEPDRIEVDLAEFNAGFKNPMTKQELDHTLTSARRKGYKISSKAMMRLLDITPEEEAVLHNVYHFNGTPKQKKPSKKERYPEVFELYQTGKYTLKELVKETGISEPTIRKILRKNGVPDRTERCRSRYEEIRFLRNQCGMPVESIASKMNCSIRTVWRALEETKQQPEQKEEMAAKKSAASYSESCQKQKNQHNNEYHYPSGADFSAPSSGIIPPHKDNLSGIRAAPSGRRPDSAATESPSLSSCSAKQHHPLTPSSRSTSLPLCASSRASPSHLDRTPITEDFHSKLLGKLLPCADDDGAYEMFF